jgi:hypothetical protein
MKMYFYRKANKFLWPTIIYLQMFGNDTTSSQIHHISIHTQSTFFLSIEGIKCSQSCSHTPSTFHKCGRQWQNIHSILHVLQTRNQVMLKGQRNEVAKKYSNLCQITLVENSNLRSPTHTATWQYRSNPTFLEKHMSLQPSYSKTGMNNSSNMLRYTTPVIAHLAKEREAWLLFLRKQQKGHYINLYFENAGILYLLSTIILVTCWSHMHRDCFTAANFSFD